MNTEQIIRQLNAADKTIQTAKDDQKELLVKIGREFRVARLNRHIKSVTLAKVIKESPVFIYLVENGSLPLNEKRVNKIWQAIERLGRK